MTLLKMKQEAEEKLCRLQEDKVIADLASGMKNFFPHQNLVPSCVYIFVAESASRKKRKKPVTVIGR